MNDGIIYLPTRIRTNPWNYGNILFLTLKKFVPTAAAAAANSSGPSDRAGESTRSFIRE